MHWTELKQDSNNMLTHWMMFMSAQEYLKNTPRIPPWNIPKIPPVLYPHEYTKNILQQCVDQLDGAHVRQSESWCVSSVHLNPWLHYITITNRALLAQMCANLTHTTHWLVQHIVDTSNPNQMSFQCQPLACCCQQC